ncbi:glutamyl-tRNA reductase [Paenibacillus darwinianus]|uniref:Glutamyl-tRNA reductase n=1 Tax=Paenibacillus darwinianus TaxID=1380763 RepID=A0A9W5S2L9_9BACL|nr:glutamyl-tRNA reductase [Paenibacillus darwinianus]EXX89363.1 glutamyl-tRNA reductase [Paenibacillus darwinianus]EXX90156.1 glutamyl-tRNA reductase [Paenibacillus darwinianus]EXX91472.1 glutamyl-tRNA reductase [Paenibacillus darwinianus]
MHIIAVGLNYRTAPVEVRERFTFSEQELPEAIRQLKQTKSILEGVIVATCNRTELYAVTDRHHLCGHYIRSFMEQWFGLPRDSFTDHLYMYEDDKAIEHLFRVTSGLDSMVIGETQILGQVRDAFLLAQEQKATGTLFNMLFKQSVTTAKRAHAETSIGEAAVSVSYAAVELGKRIFGRFNGKTVMIVGAGKMSELTAKHLYANGAERVLVVNRTYDRAVELADKFNGVAMTLEEARHRLHEADVVISSTGSQEFVLNKEMVEREMERRKSRPLFMIDIAVPRDLDPTIASVPNVFLYDIDDLEGIVESNLEQRRKEAVKIEAMIADEIEQFRRWYRTLGVVPLIRSLQTKAEAIHEETMDSLMKKLPNLDEHEMKVIRKLTKSIVNQMMHDPILRIKEMAGEKRADEAMDMFVKLFALEEPLAQLKRTEQRAAEAAQTIVKAGPAIEPPLAISGRAGGGIAVVKP